jgi:hypothetical protein
MCAPFLILSRRGSVPLGGIDTQYPRGAYYPGVFQFSLELSSNRLPSKTQAPEVAVLTARARELKCVLALNPQHPVCVRYNEAGKRNGRARWGIGDDYVFYGSVLEWLFQDRKGKRKYDNFRLLLEKDASRQCIVDYVLVGDTGERDEEAAERIIAEFGDRVRTVFLHVVTDQPTVAVPRDRLYRGVPFLYFRTYVGAAVKATLYGMLGVPALQRVMSAAQEELAPSSGCSRWRELEWDLEEARALVRTSSIPGSIQILQFLAKSPPGSFPVPEILGKGQRRKLVTV